MHTKNLAIIGLLILIATAIALGVVLMVRPEQSGDLSAGKDADQQTRERHPGFAIDASAAQERIRITQEGFFPEEITVQRGDSVVWINEASEYRWPASNLHPTHSIYAEFDPLEPLAPGESWSFRFEQEGSWQYHDHLRPSKEGVIIVEG
ncbi:MAG: hypothetical protein WD850_00735 [Candidatus Spechtbacterales bacterium]